ncbi:unnamed protein product [Linum tenue]|uniref:Fe2OG dioxygenase domain-containing protein n=1 Tax=Linum tenue TaxID=586396 RepID=A0AAV0HU83_9ROSI|nr:unnamed protein product [Linum tenue]
MHSSTNQLISNDVVQTIIVHAKTSLCGISSSTLTDKPVLSKSKKTLTSRAAGFEQGQNCFTVIGNGITNHGVESCLDKVRTVFKQFVSLPEEEKLKWKREVDGFEGYGTDPVPGDLLVRDWSARLSLTIRPEEFRQLKYWPENPAEFREVVDEYSSKLVTIYEVILKALARSLNLKETTFLHKMGEPWIMNGRFNFYPPCPRPDLVFGLKPHSDSTVLTVLLQDKELGGLQIEKDGQWFRVPIVPGALVINVGEQLEILSNGVFKSLYHRAMVDSEGERISLAMLSLSNPEVIVEPIEELVNEERPPMYRKVKYEETTHFLYYQSGRRVIDDARI